MLVDEVRDEGVTVGDGWEGQRILGRGGYTRQP